MASKEVSPMLLECWNITLGNLDAHQLDKACELTAKTWRIHTIPMPGEILSHINIAEERAAEIEAEEQWQGMMRLVDEHYHPDLGYSGPKMTVPMKRALEAAGGMRYVESCPETELQWAKKRFIEYYLKSAQVEAAAENHLLPGNRLQEITLRIGELAEKKSL